MGRIAAYEPASSPTTHTLEILNKIIQAFQEICHQIGNSYPGNILTQEKTALGGGIRASIGDSGKPAAIPPLRIKTHILISALPVDYHKIAHE